MKHASASRARTVDMDDVMNNYIHSDFSEDNSGVFDDVVTDAD